MRKNLIAALIAGLLALGAVACQTDDAADPGVEEPADDPGVEEPAEPDEGLDEGTDDTEDGA